jgi:cell division protein FtsA
VGGDHLTSDIAQGLHLPLETAEMVKRRHGHARGSMLDPNAAFAARPFGQEQTVQVRMVDLAAIVEPRIEELFSLVRQEIKRSGYDGLLPAGVVLTGGSSPLPGTREVGRSAAPAGAFGAAGGHARPGRSVAFAGIRYRLWPTGMGQVAGRTKRP